MWSSARQPQGRPDVRPPLEAFGLCLTLGGMQCNRQVLGGSEPCLVSEGPGQTYLWHVGTCSLESLVDSDWCGHFRGVQGGEGAAPPTTSFAPMPRELVANAVGLGNAASP